MARQATVTLAKQFILRGSSSKSSSSTPKGCLAVYVGDEAEKKRYVVPVSYLSQPSFQHLLSRSEEEYGFHHPMGGLTIPCHEDTFLDVISNLSS